MAETQEAEIALLIMSQVCSVRALLVLSIWSSDFLFIEFLLEYSRFPMLC